MFIVKILKSILYPGWALFSAFIILLSGLINGGDITCSPNAELIRTDKFTIIGFLCVLRVVCSVRQTLSDRLALVHMERNQPCCCHSHHILSKRKSHPQVTFS